jgi:sec-independent protein translocase protein TatA
MMALVGIGTPELIWIVVAIGLLFGATRIPQLMKGVGQGIKEFKTAVKDDETAPATAAPKPDDAPGSQPG